MERTSNANYVGCACDHKFVKHTATMLTSLDLNGSVPDATVIVVAFELTEEDRETILAGAGSLAGKLRFLDVTPDMFPGLDHSEFREIYPLPVLGRLLIPTAISEPGARLLTLDSDMIVNASVRPLFDMDMQDQFLAAIHDVPNKSDPSYFNSGLMVIEVDVFNTHRIGQRSIEWIASRDEHPTFPDQDALNHVIGHEWYKLDRHWNWFYTGPDCFDRPLELAHYEQAKVAHFTAGKPWNYFFHVGKPLYQRYRTILEDRVVERKRLRSYADRTFIAFARSVFLGTSAGAGGEDLREKSATEVLRAVVSSRDFVSQTLIPISMGEPLPDDNRAGRPEELHLLWCADRLPLGGATRAALDNVVTWHDLLTAILTDENFRSVTGLNQTWDALMMIQERIASLASEPQNHIAPDEGLVDTSGTSATVTILSEVRAAAEQGSFVGATGNLAG